MRYADLKLNDTVDCAQGICVSFWTQGCPFRCQGCQNPTTWDFNGGKEFTSKVLEQIKNGLTANGIRRDFSVLGGEPLCDENLFLTTMVISEIRSSFPDITIYLWTGYTIEELKAKNNPKINFILDKINILIEGRFILAQRDITLPLRGSRNQRIIRLDKNEKI